MRLFVFLLILFFGTSAAFAQCPEWLKSKNQQLPLCPEGSGPTLIPETYPIGAFVISDRGTSGIDPAYTAEVVEKVLKGAGSKNPLIVLPVTERTFEKIKDRIQGMNASDAQKKIWMDSLLRVHVRSYSWQQDVFQPFVNPKTGKVILREVENYEPGDDTFKKTMEAMRACGFEIGEGLKSTESHSGTYGGNIETLPGGLCMIGDSYFSSAEKYKQYADQVCAQSEADRIKAPTKWLKVGHTDEIIKVIRNNKRPAPCDFSIVLASPEKGLDLLKTHKKDVFLKVPESKYEKSEQTALRRLMRHEGLQEICLKYIAMKKQGVPGNGKSQPGVARLPWIQKAFADELDGALSVDQAEACQSMTNEDVYNVINKDANLKEYNQLVQNEMNNLRKDVTAKLHKKFPKCQMDIIEAPDLFYGGSVVKTAQGSELAKSMGSSLLPNPANSVSINDTLISPEPSNFAFKNHLDKEYRARGLNTDYVDTFDYGHSSGGNLHCTTNTIHVCKPRGLK